MKAVKPDLIALYEQAKARYGDQTYRFVSAILQDAKIEHQRWFTGQDHEQSWRNFKGRNLEKLVEHILGDTVRQRGWLIANGNKLIRSHENNLSSEQSQVRRNLLVDYGVYGYHLPDVDLVIYKPQSGKVAVVISSKVTLRERITQTGYWRLKLRTQKHTKHIKVLFVTLDEDGTLTRQFPSKKGRAIAEIDTDGSYVITAASIESSRVVKPFGDLFTDLDDFLSE